MYPTLFSLGPLEISSFGLMMIVGFAAAGWLAADGFEKLGLPRDEALRLLTWAVLGGILGSKLWYQGEAVARSGLEPLLADLEGRGALGWLNFLRAGITWYGGFLGGAVAVLWSAHRARLPLLDVMNATAPACAIGQALGRVGCFLVGDDWGSATDAPWGVAFPHGIDPVDFPVHPTQLYETGWLLAIFPWLMYRRTRSRFVFGEYLILAGLGRFWIEMFRRNPTFVGDLTNAQLTALAAITLGIVGWWRLARRQPIPPAS